MNDLWKGMSISRKALKSLALISGICLAFEGLAPAHAQPQPPCSTTNAVAWTINNPSADDQRKITDILSRYAWALDDWDTTSFVGLFVADDDDVYYEYCNAGGQVFKLTPGNSDPTKNLETQIDAITDDLEARGLKTRHLVTNTLFNQSDGIVHTKSTVLVTLQAGGMEAPVLDYTADVRGTLVSDGKEGWLLQNLTVYADNAPSVTKKR